MLKVLIYPLRSRPTPQNKLYRSMTSGVTNLHTGSNEQFDILSTLGWSGGSNQNLYWTVLT